MENYICIGGNKTELTEEQLRQLGFEVKKKSPFERVSDDNYYLIYSWGIADCDRDVNNTIDDKRYNAANYCTDKSLMEQRALHETLNRLLWRYSMEHDGDKIDWNDCEKAKYYVYYNVILESWDTGECINWDFGACFYAKVVAQNAIREIVEPFMKEHPEFKW